MTSPTPLIAGNWKMNGVAASLAEAQAVAAGIQSAKARVAICPPAAMAHGASATSRIATPVHWQE